MNDQANDRFHWSFWPISAVALIWNGMGIMNYFMQMNPDALATFPDAARAIVDGRPVWATGGFAIAVFGGTLGGLFLLLRKSAAYYLFIASLLGTIVTMVHTISRAGSATGFGPFEISMYILMPLAVAVFFAWYSRRARNKGWLS